MVAQLQQQQSTGPVIEMVPTEDQEPELELPHEDGMSFPLGVALAVPIALTLWGGLIWVAISIL